MAALSLKKLVKETQGLLKSSKPHGLKESYWELLKDQVQSEGTWDEVLMNDIKKKISDTLEKFNKHQLFEIWEQTEISMNYSGDENSIPVSKLKEDISEDILNAVLDLLDDRSSETIFENRYVEDEDSDEDDFDSDSFGDFADEDDFEDDEFNDEEK